MLLFPHPISRHLCSLLTHNIMLTFALIWLIALGTCNCYSIARAERVMGWCFRVTGGNIQLLSAAHDASRTRTCFWANYIRSAGPIFQPALPTSKLLSRCAST
ncbi:hypothetical protein F5X97DRAFT_98534 [Nemania serpens]|nr:hypothetical protein F5X97DRAFT_98534 [Nemania serpens]